MIFFSPQSRTNVCFEHILLISSKGLHVGTSSITTYWSLKPMFLFYFNFFIANWHDHAWWLSNFKGGGGELTHRGTLVVVILSTIEDCSIRIYILKFLWENVYIGPTKLNTLGLLQRGHTTLGVIRIYNGLPTLAQRCHAIWDVDKIIVIYKISIIKKVGA